MKRNKIFIVFVLFLIPPEIFAQAISVKVMSMNIKEGGQLANYNADVYADCIKEQNPDFVVFQEIDRFTNRNGNQDMLTAIAAKLGMFPLYGKAMDYSGGAFGNGILSKYPFFNAKTVVSRPPEAAESRSCLWMDVILPNGRMLRIAGTHLDVRSEQARISMLGTINVNLLTDEDYPTLLIGDFNATPDSDTMKYAKIRGQDIGEGTGNTLPSTNPTSRIDYVMGYPKTWLKKSYEIVCYPGLSDHCFIVAELEFP